jgi:hypothetical protein
MASHNKSSQWSSQWTGRRKSARFHSAASSESNIKREEPHDQLTQENLQKIPDTSRYFNLDRDAPIPSIEVPDPPLSNSTMEDKTVGDVSSQAVESSVVRSDSEESMETSLFTSMIPRSHPNYVQLTHSWFHRPDEYQTGGLVDLANCHWCQFGIWKSHQLYPTSIMNQVAGQKHILLDVKKFTFIEANILSEGVEQAGEEFESGCDCKRDRDCTTSGCACLQDIDTDGKEPKAYTSAYYDTGAAKGFLRKEMLDSRDPIYECNDKCSCTEDCANRVVGKGRKTSLQVFRTDDGRGWGMCHLVQFCVSFLT